MRIRIQRLSRVMISFGIRVTRRIYHMLFHLLSAASRIYQIEATSTFLISPLRVDIGRFKFGFRFRLRKASTLAPSKAQLQIQKPPRRKKRTSSFRVAQTVVVVLIVLVVSAGVYAWHYQNMKRERKRKRREDALVKDKGMSGNILVKKW